MRSVLPRCFLAAASLRALNWAALPATDHSRGAPFTGRTALFWDITHTLCRLLEGPWDKSYGLILATSSGTGKTVAVQQLKHFWASLVTGAEQGSAKQGPTDDGFKSWAAGCRWKTPREKVTLIEAVRSSRPVFVYCGFDGRQQPITTSSSPTAASTFSYALRADEIDLLMDQKRFDAADCVLLRRLVIMTAYSLQNPDAITVVPDISAAIDALLVGFPTSCKLKELLRELLLGSAAPARGRDSYKRALVVCIDDLQQLDMQYPTLPRPGLGLGRDFLRCLRELQEYLGWFGIVLLPIGIGTGAVDLCDILPSRGSLEAIYDGGANHMTKRDFEALALAHVVPALALAHPAPNNPQQSGHCWPPLALQEAAKENPPAVAHLLQVALWPNVRLLVGMGACCSGGGDAAAAAANFTPAVAETLRLPPHTPPPPPPPPPSGQDSSQGTPAGGGTAAIMTALCLHHESRSRSLFDAYEVMLLGGSRGRSVHLRGSDGLMDFIEGPSDWGESQTVFTPLFPHEVEGYGQWRLVPSVLFAHRLQQAMLCDLCGVGQSGYGAKKAAESEDLAGLIRGLLPLPSPRLPSRPPPHHGSRDQQLLEQLLAIIEAELLIIPTGGKTNGAMERPLQEERQRRRMAHKDRAFAVVGTALYVGVVAMVSDTNDWKKNRLMGGLVDWLLASRCVFAGSHSSDKRVSPVVLPRPRVGTLGAQTAVDATMAGDRLVGDRAAGDKLLFGGSGPAPPSPFLFAQPPAHCFPFEAALSSAATAASVFTEAVVAALVAAAPRKAPVYLRAGAHDPADGYFLFPIRVFDEETGKPLAGHQWVAVIAADAKPSIDHPAEEQEAALLGACERLAQAVRAVKGHKLVDARLLVLEEASPSSGPHRPPKTAPEQVECSSASKEYRCALAKVKRSVPRFDPVCLRLSSDGVSLPPFSDLLFASRRLAAVKEGAADSTH